MKKRRTCLTGHLPFFPPESGLPGVHAEDGVRLERLAEMRRQEQWVAGVG